MKFGGEDKKGAISYMTSLVGEHHKVEEGYDEIVVFGLTKESVRKVYLAVGRNEGTKDMPVDYEPKYRAVKESASEMGGSYWSIEVNKDNNWVRLH